ncbi:MAG: hypothetical protein QW413_04870 [Nitrososphaerota archaeon]
MSTSSIPMEKGVLTGHLVLKCPGRAPLAEIMKHRPDIEAFLHEIESRGWLHFYVDHQASLVGEIKFNETEYQIVPWSILKGPYGMVVDLSKSFPQIAGIELEKLIYNLYTRNTFPRAITIDVQNKLITYISDVFWNWQEEWKKDNIKLSKAIEICEMIRWLVNEKKFNLTEGYNKERLSELLDIFSNLKSQT